MSTLYAFINPEYYAVWCKEANVDDTNDENRHQFLKEFGTPIVHSVDPQSNSFLKLEKGHCIHLNFNYYTELRRRFPNTPIDAPLEQEAAADSFVRSIVSWVSGVVNKTILRRGEHNKTKAL